MSEFRLTVMRADERKTTLKNSPMPTYQFGSKDPRHVLGAK